MIRVYHAKNPTFFSEPLPKLADLHVVAEVPTEDLEAAYVKTNSIHTAWWEKPDVKFLGSPDHGMKGCRSTSVGDVLERDGKFYVVDSVGFKEMELT